MKKILIGILIFFISSTSSFANFYIDGFASYIDAGDAKILPGTGIALAFDIHRNVNLIARGGLNTITKRSDSYISSKKDKYSHTMGLAGIEYTYHIYKYRLGWKSSLLAGGSSTKIELKETFTDTSINPTSTKDSDTGMSAAIWTGIQFYATQHISPFLDVGYHYSYYSNDFKDDSIYGFHMMIGIRFTVWGINKKFDDDY